VARAIRHASHHDERCAGGRHRAVKDRETRLTRIQKSEEDARNCEFVYDPVTYRRNAIFSFASAASR